jgi:hypothetical protein
MKITTSSAVCSIQSAQNKMWIIYMTDYQAAIESLHTMGGCGGEGAIHA